MREKIRILEGIWGDGAGAEGDAGPASGGGRGRSGVAAGQDAGEKAAQPEPEAEETSAVRDEGSQGERPRHSDRPGKDSGGGGGGGVEGEGEDVGASTTGGAEVEGGKAAATEGGGGDAGVDAWLISYNRRLKSELERLRERTRQAEDRWGGLGVAGTCWPGCAGCSAARSDSRSQFASRRCRVGYAEAAALGSRPCLRSLSLAFCPRGCRLKLILLVLNRKQANMHSQHPHGVPALKVLSIRGSADRTQTSYRVATSAATGYMKNRRQISSLFRQLLGANVDNNNQRSPSLFHPQRSPCIPSPPPLPPLPPLGRLKNVEDERVAEAAELADRRQDVKRLEQDLVDAHQVVEAGKTMLRAFQSGPVAKQFGKLVGRGGAGTKGAGSAGALEEDDYLEGMEDGGGGGAEEGDATGSEGFSAADRLLGAVRGWKG